MNRNKIVLLAALALLVALTSVLPVLAQEDGLLIWADENRAPLLTELGAKFTEEFGIPVTVEQYGLGDARDQLLIRGPAGEGPDILLVAHDHLGQLVANAAIDPMTTLSEDAELLGNFNEAALTLATYGGALYGLPYATENIALVRNVDLVPEVPATWADIRALSEQFATDGTAQYALVVQNSGGDPYHHFPIISAFGGYVFGKNEDGTFNVADIGLNSEGGLAAGAWLSDMYTNQYLPTEVTGGTAIELFQNQDAAMIVTGPWNSLQITAAAEAGGFAFSIDPFPGVEGVSEHGAPFSGGQVFVLSAFSEKKLEAESFLLDYVATDEFMQALFDVNPRAPAWKNVDTSSDPNQAAFGVAGANAIPMPAIPEMGSVWSAWSSAVTLISQGADSVTSLNDAVVQINNAIALSQSLTERTVVVAGSLQDKLGCPGAWLPECLETRLFDEDGDGVYTGTFMVPAGDYEYKIALDASWDENYGANGVAGGDNIKLSLAADTEVTFSFDDNADPKVITDSVNNP